MRHVAYHEAGHAIVAYLCGQAVEKIAVYPDDSEYLGYVDLESIHLCSFSKSGIPINENAKRLDLYKKLLVDLAGVKAERLIFRYVSGAGQAVDTEQIYKVADLLAIGGHGLPAGKYVDRASSTVTKMLSSHLPLLHEVARRLIDKRKISGDEFLEIMTSKS